MKVLAVLCLLALATQGFAQDEADAQTFGFQKRYTAWEIIQANPDLSTLAAAIQANNLVAPLNDRKNPVTVWAPTNAALGAVVGSLPAGTALTNPAVVQILLAHVAPGKYNAVLNKSSVVNTLNGQISRIGGRTKGEKVSSQTFAVTWRVTFNWRDGQNRTVSTSSMTTAKAGIVYVANGVLLPRNAFPNIAALTTFYNYTTVRDLVVANNLLATVDNPAAPKTVFGPNNQAFANIAGVLATLTPAQVTAALTYHVSIGQLFTVAWPNATAIPTALTGQTLGLVNPNRIAAAGFTAGQLSTVVLSNIYFPGGIFQGIDTVLIPKL